MDWQHTADTAPPDDDDSPAVIAWRPYDLSECEIAWRVRGQWVDKEGYKVEPPDFYMFLDHPDAF
jgi:hypothetical protein